MGPSIREQATGSVRSIRQAAQQFGRHLEIGETHFTMGLDKSMTKKAGRCRVPTWISGLNMPQRKELGRHVKREIGNLLDWRRIVVRVDVCETPDSPQIQIGRARSGVGAFSRVALNVRSLLVLHCSGLASVDQRAGILEQDRR